LERYQKPRPSVADILPSHITTQVLISSAVFNETAPPPADGKRREMSDHAAPNGQHNGQHAPSARLVSGMQAESHLAS
jgi:hypothetical protein